MSDAASADPIPPVAVRLPAEGTRWRRQEDLIWLALASAVVVIALSLSYDAASGRLAPRMWSGALLPPVCMSKVLFGIDCPGCGLTRSTVLLMQGQFAASFQMHHLGPFVGLLIVSQIPYRLALLLRPSLPRLPGWLATAIFLVLAVAMIGNWLVGFLM